jgi:DNA-binding LytR/AlgR family response regulator
MQCYAKLDEISKQLPGDTFIRTHQSFIVNIYHVTEVSENYFRVGSLIINISKKYLKAAKDKYFDYLFTHMNGTG